MIDAHCHIDQFNDPFSVLNFLERSKTYTISVTNLPSHFVEGYKHYKGFDFIKPAIGFHPLMFEKENINIGSQLTLFSNFINEASFIGEIGLDYTSKFKRLKKEQLEVFDTITRIAANENKIASIHSRQAEEDVVRILKKNRVKKVVLHWYSGPLGVLEDAIAEGYYFSLNEGMIRSKKGRNIIKRLPRNNVLTETDSPFANSDGNTYKTDSIPKVHKYLSEIWNLPEKKVVKKIRENLYNLTNLNKVKKVAG